MALTQPVHAYHRITNTCRVVYVIRQSGDHFRRIFIQFERFCRHKATILHHRADSPQCEPVRMPSFRDDSLVAACAAVARRGVNNDSPASRRRLSRQVVPENADVMPERNRYCSLFFFLLIAVSLTCGVRTHSFADISTKCVLHVYRDW